MRGHFNDWQHGFRVYTGRKRLQLQEAVVIGSRVGDNLKNRLPVGEVGLVERTVPPPVPRRNIAYTERDRSLAGQCGSSPVLQRPSIAARLRWILPGLVEQGRLVGPGNARFGGAKRSPQRTYNSPEAVDSCPRCLAGSDPWFEVGQDWSIVWLCRQAWEDCRETAAQPDASTLQSSRWLGAVAPLRASGARNLVTQNAIRRR